MDDDHGEKQSLSIVLEPRHSSVDGSFVEEGRNVRLGRKPTVNCWTVITVNGKEFVVEKEFKDGNAFKNSAQVNESTFSPFLSLLPIAMRE